MIKCFKCEEKAVIYQEDKYWCAPCRLNYVGIPWPKEEDKRVGVLTKPEVEGKMKSF